MTIKEIAELAGVSVSTVSKIVNNKDQYINPKTRAKVLQIVKEYNYTPYGSVKNISSSRTFMLGVLLDDAAISDQMINGILQTAQANSYGIILLDSRKDPDLELRHITMLCKNRVDGVIWVPVGAGSQKHLHHFTDQNIPVCCAGSNQFAVSYHIDFSALGYAMAQKLLDYRHTQIACLLKKDSGRSRSVLEGYKKCLFDNQIVFDPDMLIEDDSPGYYRKLLECKATGIICSHFASALSLYTQLKKLHYDIPEDFSVLSLRDSLADRFSLSHISGLTIPYYEFGAYVCAQLIAMRENPDFVPDDYVFSPDTDFCTEESVAIPSFLRVRKTVVIGSIHTDFTFNVEHAPQIGKTTEILNSVTFPGGKGINQAIGVARLGGQVSLIGEIGNDTYSPYIMSILEKEHVSTDGIHKDMAQPTGTAYIYIEKNGDSMITIQSGANSKLLAKKIEDRQHLFEKAGYCLISTEIPLEATLAAAHIAKKYDVKTIVKPATLNEIPEELYRNIDIFIPNQKEAAVLCPGCDTPEKQAEYLLRKGIPTVIITLGEEGCYLRTDSIEKYFPAGDFMPVDTTGGADAFISALASYLIDGFPLEKAIRIATYAAGFCISRQGVVAGLVDSGTLEAYIKKMEPELLHN